MRKTVLVFIFLIGIHGFSGCKEARAHEVELISVEEMKTHLKMENVQLIDVQSSEDFQSSHIFNARNIVYDKSFRKKLDDLDKNKPVIIYCKSGRTSQKAVKILQQAGFSKIYELEGGITNWLNQGESIQ